MKANLKSVKSDYSDCGRNPFFFIKVKIKDQLSCVLLITDNHVHTTALLAPDAPLSRTRADTVILSMETNGDGFHEDLRSW